MQGHCCSAKAAKCCPEKAWCSAQAATNLGFAEKVFFYLRKSILFYLRSPECERCRSTDAHGARGLEGNWRKLLHDFLSTNEVNEQRQTVNDQ